MKLKIVIVLVLLTGLYGCATSTLKAPCNESGSNCWPRTKINQWDNR